MPAKQEMTSIGQPVPELPVADVERAQQHYRDALGFEIGWLYPDKQMGAVSRDKVAIFFRKREAPFEPAVLAAIDGGGRWRRADCRSRMAGHRCGQGPLRPRETFRLACFFRLACVFGHPDSCVCQR